MTRLKDATFEGASLTGTNGFTSTTGSPTLDATSKIKGTYSARTNWLSATNMNGTISGLNVSEVWFSFYIYAASLPSSGSPRVVTLGNGSTQLNLTLSSAGVINARNNATALGAVATITANTLYRIGIHAKVSSSAAAADAVYDIYITSSGSPDAAFGAAANSTSNNVMNTTNANFTNIVFGMNNGVAATADVYWDNIRVDDVSMPTDDVASNNTPKTITVTVTDVVGIQRGISFIRALSSTIIPTLNKGMVTLKTITATVGNSIIALKNIGKPIIRTVAVSLTRNTTIPKNILISVTDLIVIKKDFSKTITRSITSTINAIVGKGYYRNATITVTISSVISKNILKPITVIPSLLVSIGPKSIAKSISISVIDMVTALYGNLVLKNITLAVTSGVSRSLGIIKNIEIMQGSLVSVQRSLTLLIVSTVTSTSILYVKKQIIFTIHIVVNSIVTFSKLLTNELTNLYFRKNIRALTLGFKNSALQIIGKNSRAINLQDTNNDDN